MISTQNGLSARSASKPPPKSLGLFWRRPESRKSSFRNMFERLRNSPVLLEGYPGLDNDGSQVCSSP